MDQARVYQILQQEGGCCLRKEGRLFLYHRPKRRFQCMPGPTCWQQLSAFIESCHFPAVGFIGYEMGAWSDPEYPLSYQTSPYPSVVFYEMESVEPVELPPKKGTAFNFSLVKKSDDSAQYLDKIETIRASVARGEVYQVNLSQEFEFAHSGSDPVEIFCTLYQINPAPHAAFLNCGDFSIGSLSPELFVQRKGLEVVTCPIKGTAPRGCDPLEDERFRVQLTQSEKDHAELLMITDLMRHDLTRVCQPRSVEVYRLWACEAHRDVFHLVSTLKGLSDRPSVDLVQALFPAGSITGCPKRAAIEHIAVLEGRPRGVYTGAIGLFEPSGDFSLNVAIRTYMMNAQTLSLQLGGAILYDSSPQGEYQETLHKGRSFFEVFGAGDIVRHPLYPTARFAL